jgi:hypothetical protein
LGLQHLKREVVWTLWSEIVDLQAHNLWLLAI